MSSTAIFYAKLHYLVTYLFIKRGYRKVFFWMVEDFWENIKNLKIFHILENVTWHTKLIHKLNNNENKTTEKRFKNTYFTKLIDNWFNG